MSELALALGTTGSVSYALLPVSTLRRAGATTSSASALLAVLSSLPSDVVEYTQPAAPGDQLRAACDEVSAGDVPTADGVGLPALELPAFVFIAIESPALRRLVCRRLGQAPDLRIRYGRLDDHGTLADPGDHAATRIVILDEPQFDHVGADAVRVLCAQHRDLRMLLVCERVDDQRANDLFDAGIHGMLPATETAAAWRRAVRAVARGELWLPRALLTRMMKARCSARADTDDGIGGQSLAMPRSPLTRREAAVVVELRMGRSNKEIALRLGVCEDTVKKHLHSVFAKLGVRRRTELMKRTLPGT